MQSLKNQPPAILQQVMQIDRIRLRRAWEKLQSGKSSDAAALRQWHAQAEVSAQKRGMRTASLPLLEYDEVLPITAHRQQIIDLIQSRQVLVVCGETGSGKSTQLPKLCLEAGLGCGGMVGHTQPRRLAARAVASRLADELKTQVGELVGFKIRFNDVTKANTLVKLMTDGVLLAETQSDRFLDHYDAIIIDEAHERSLNIDFLLGYLRQLTARRPELKLIITSATIDPEKFAQHFADQQGPAPIVEVSGRTYPVEMLYRPIAETIDADNVDDQAQLQAIAEATDELLAGGSGDILTFLATERDIRVTAKHLRGHFLRQGREKSIEILPLYARLSHAEQNKIFAGHSKRRIVLATNVAESSLTVPGIHSVIDTGLARISRYAPRSKVQRLPIEDISQASANQRAGRCGRLGPGTCIRLFDEEDFARRPKFTTPEIRRSDLASVLLQSLVLGLGPLEEFPLLDPPSAESIRDGANTLWELGAVDDNGRLTPTGRQLGRIPSDPRIGRMLLEASERNCLSEVIVIAAALETQDVRQRPAGQRPQADEAHASFLDPHSDFLSLIRLWDFYDKLRSELGRARLQKALNQKFLSFQGFREWGEIVRQLRQLLSEAGIRPGQRKLELPAVEVIQDRESEQKSHQREHRRGKPTAADKAIAKLKRPEGYAAIHQSLLTGLLSGVANKGERHEYKAARGLTLALWPGSGLFSRQPKWIMAAEILETTRRYARTVGEIDVEWIETAAERLLKHSYSDPHWSSKSGSAMVYRRSTLYGLPIVVGRRTPLAPIDPETARSLLIEHGLVAGDWNCREKFYLHNQELIADMHELVQRTRSREYILDRFHLANFYGQHIPLHLFDLSTLKSWIKQHEGSEAEKALWMRPEDLISKTEAVANFESNFPNAIEVGSTTLPLDYRFEPGHVSDGVTVTVPQAALRQVSPEALAWLVPGLLEEKILHVIRGLPKSLRTNFVPAPDVAKKIARDMESLSYERPFREVLCEQLSRHAGERIQIESSELAKLPEHLQFAVRVVDDAGNLLDSGRDLERLQAEYAPATAALTVTQSDVASDWKNRAVTPSDFERLPEPVAVRRGGLVVAAFPALVDLGQAVEMRLMDTPAEAARLTLGGLTRLFAIKHHRSLRSHVAHLPSLTETSVKLGHLISSHDLGHQLQDLLVRVALVEGQAMITSAEEFEARNALAIGRISVAAQEVTNWLPKLAEQIHQLRLVLEQAPQSWREVFDDVRSQQDDLLHPGFLADTAWAWLAEFPRYLQAIRLRIERLKSGGLPKDRKLREPIDAACSKYRELVAAKTMDAVRLVKLHELKWMIEELRVSIFAQQLGTKISVSPKKVEAYIDAIA